MYAWGVALDMLYNLEPAHLDVLNTEDCNSIDPTRPCNHGEAFNDFLSVPIVPGRLQNIDAGLETKQSKL